MGECRLKGVALVLIVLFVWSSLSFEICNGKEDRHLKQTKASPAPRTRSNSAVFNVLRYGAKGNGHTDDTKAFEAAWAATCKVAASTMLVPSGFVFLVGPITFAGPNCQPNIVFQLDGKIIAPTSLGPWGSGLRQWLEFKWLQKFTVQGKGIIEGQGYVWWGSPQGGGAGGKRPSIKPTAVRFYGSSGVTVTGITIQHSPQTHLKFDSCTAVQVSYITISSPGYSPNTDGIHLQDSRDVTIFRSNLACGDDCISIQTGCSNVLIQNINCALGHGISIGGLGADNTKACVSDILVQDITMLNTMTGVRIKTWQGGSGSVQGIVFSNIQVSEVEIPIIIDQYYCQKDKCRNQTSAVAISGVKYSNIRGTYTTRPIHFGCSDNLPCTGLSLSNIQLKSVEQNYHSDDAFCWKAYGMLTTPTTPRISCLRSGRPPNIGVQPYFTNSC